VKANEFRYKVGIYVDFTDEELGLLREYCLAHYDGLVKGSANRGGFLYGWLNMQETRPA